MHRITLSKQHMTEILYLLETIEQETKGTDAINPFVKLFERVWAPEEVFFATCLSVLGILNQNETNDSIQKNCLMYVKWDNRARGADRAHPIIYQKLTKKIQEMAIQEGCLFLRKIKNEINLQDWIRTVLGDHSEKRKLQCNYDNDIVVDDSKDGSKKQRIHLD